MKIKKKTNILIILLFLVAIISLGSVAATNDVDTGINDINSDLNNCEDSVMNFQEMVDKDATGVVNLNNNVANTTINDDVGVANDVLLQIQL